MDRGETMEVHDRDRDSEDESINMQPVSWGRGETKMRGNGESNQ